jgi:cob(I)alamin adenosyltransferase
VKIYTRRGDDGTTGLLGGDRLRKDALRIEAYGTVDELNAAVGVARAALSDREVDAALARIQEELFVLGAELATAPGVQAPEELGADRVARLESEIDRWHEELEPLRNFILPGGTAAAAALHQARTVCRRAERAVVRLGEREPVRKEALAYLNRLSDHLFVAARVANHRAGRPDVPWRPRG